jgi:hypothetical protein
MNTIAQEKLLPVGRQLLREGQELSNPTYYVVSRDEFEQLKREHAKEVEGLSYDEYCELESECWHDMLREQLKSHWEKIPDSLFQPNAVKLEKRFRAKSPAVRGLILKTISGVNALVSR